MKQEINTRLHPSLNNLKSNPTPQSSSALCLSPSFHGTYIGALSCLTISSTAGLLSDSSGVGNGILITMMTSSILSNLGLVPSSHFMYDFCWSFVLPLSLVLLLLRPSPSTTPSTLASPFTVTAADDKSTRQKKNKYIPSLALPFALASIGSFVGCFVSYFIFSPQILPSFLSFFKYEKAQMAALVSGCLCASYIGGTFNLFSAGNILRNELMTSKEKIITNMEVHTLFSALAVADCIVMALYFAFLAWATSPNNRLWKFFPSSISSNSSQKVMNAEIKGRRTVSEISSSSAKDTRDSIFTTSVMTLFISAIIVYISNNIDSKLQYLFPGVGSAILAILTTFANKLLFTTSSSRFLRPISQVFTSKQKLDIRKKTSPFLSSVCFYLFFSVIGVSANLKNILSISSDTISGAGLGLCTLLFCTSALILHVLFLFTSAFIYNSFVSFGTRRRKKISLEEITISSNSAIGGAATAAAFAGNFCAEDETKGKSLILGAIVWGVVGYGIGTMIGVSLAKLLLNRFQ